MDVRSGSMVDVDEKAKKAYTPVAISKGCRMDRVYISSREFYGVADANSERI